MLFYDGKYLYLSLSTLLLTLRTHGAKA